MGPSEPTPITSPARAVGDRTVVRGGDSFAPFRGLTQENAMRYAATQGLRPGLNSHAPPGLPRPCRTIAQTDSRVFLRRKTRGLSFRAKRSAGRNLALNESSEITGEVSGSWIDGSHGGPFALPRHLPSPFTSALQDPAALRAILQSEILRCAQNDSLLRLILNLTWL